MDALNLAIVICPNLVKGSNPARDVAIVSVPGTRAFFDPHKSSDGDGKNLQESTATLGMIITLCIRRYYEVFDEIADPSVAVPLWRALDNDAVPYSSASASGSLQQPMYVLSNEGEEEEDLDDDRSVTAIQSTTNRGQQQPQKGVSPPSAWSGVSPMGQNPMSSTVLQPKRHKNTLSSGSNSGINPATRPTHTVEPNGSIRTGGNNGYTPYPTYSKAKSAISIENGGPSSSNESGTRKGSITVGRGTTTKGSGVSVEAIGVTAEGFFTAPADTPLVPDGKGGWKNS